MSYPESWFENPLADRFAAMRKVKRVKAKRKLTYDCRHAQVLPGGIFCGKPGHSILRRRGMPAEPIVIFKGSEHNLCQRCLAFECTGEGEP